MKRLILLIIVAGFVIVQCDKKDDDSKVPAEVKTEEAKDTTRLDSAVADSAEAVVTDSTE